MNYDVCFVGHGSPCRRHCAISRRSTRFVILRQLLLNTDALKDGGKTKKTKAPSKQAQKQYDELMDIIYKLSK